MRNTKENKTKETWKTILFALAVLSIICGDLSSAFMCALIYYIIK